MSQAHPTDPGGIDTTLFDFSKNSPIPDDACMNYDRCGNIVPHNGEMCAECLRRVRLNDNVPIHQ